MPSYKTKFPSKYLRADDLDGYKDHQLMVAITRWTDEAVGNPPEEKTVLYFRDELKGLILNKTNGESIAEIAGTDDMDRWVGVKILLVSTKTDFGGKRVKCIRVEPPLEEPAETRPERAPQGEQPVGPPVEQPRPGPDLSLGDIPF